MAETLICAFDGYPRKAAHSIVYGFNRASGSIADDHSTRLVRRARRMPGLPSLLPELGVFFPPLHASGLLEANFRFQACELLFHCVLPFLLFNNFQSLCRDRAPARAPLA
jgi:hypothetical protein